MKTKRVAVLFLCLITVSCGFVFGKGQIDYDPHIDPANFVTGVNNQYFPLVPGRTLHYENTITEGKSITTESITVTTMHDTKVILGVTCMVVHDVVSENGVIIEDTYDWYAQDKAGDVWYFGEDTKALERGSWTKEGSWEAGVKGAKPGIIMYADPKAHIGVPYRQEYFKGEAEDMAEVLGVNQPVSVKYGSYTNCVKTKDYTDLEPKVIENKYFAPGIGPVLVTIVQGGKEREELVSITTG